MSRVIVVTSGKGGVGKSNICINTALCLSGMNYKTCLFDADLGLANANVLLGIDQNFSLDDVIFNEKKIDDIVLHTQWGFDIIPGSSGVDKIANLSSSKLNKLVQTFATLSNYDYFLIDTASGIAKNVITFCLASQETIIILTPEKTSLTDGYALLKVLNAHHYAGNVRILVNNCTSVQLAKKTYARYKNVVDNNLGLSISPAGIILRDPSFEKAVSLQKPLLEIYPQSVAATCIQAFVSNIVERWEVSTSASSLATFWQRYFKLFSPDRGTDRDKSKKTSVSCESDIGNSKTSYRNNQIQKTENIGEITISDSSRQVRSVEEVSLEKSLHSEETAPLCSTNIANEKSGPATYADERNILQEQSARDKQLFSPEHIMRGAFQLISLGESSRVRVVELILGDPILVLNTIKLASLKASLKNHKGINIHEFLETVPMSQIRAMLLKTVVEYVYSKSTSSAEADNFLFWNTSRRRAELAHEIALLLDYPYPDDVYICGLLLDIGKLSLSSSALENYDSDHAGRGAEMLKALHVNTMICDGLRFQHYPEEQIQTAFDLVRIVYVANCLFKPQLPEQKHVEILRDLTIDNLKNLQNKVRQKDFQFKDSQNSTLNDFKRQVRDYLLLQAIMPQIAIDDCSDYLQSVFNSIQTLLGCNNIICFMASSNNCLEVRGASCDVLYEQSKGIKVPLDLPVSLLVKALVTDKAQFFEPLSASRKTCLMDKQLNSLLDNTGMVCVPLKRADDKIGAIVCGIDRKHIDILKAKRELLSHLAAHITNQLSLHKRRTSSLQKGNHFD